MLYQEDSPHIVDPFLGTTVLSGLIFPLIMFPYILQATEKLHIDGYGCNRGECEGNDFQHAHNLMTVPKRL